MATTTLTALMAVIRATLDALDGWKPAEGPLPATAPEGDGFYRVAPSGGPSLAAFFGVESEQAFDQDVTVALHRLLLGDPAEEDPDFLDAARAVADALELATGWPAGFHCLTVVSRGGVERGWRESIGQETEDSPWGRVLIVVRVTYQAPWRAE